MRGAQPRDRPRAKRSASARSGSCFGDAETHRLGARHHPDVGNRVPHGRGHDSRSAPGWSMARSRSTACARSARGAKTNTLNALALGDLHRPPADRIRPRGSASWWELPSPGTMRATRLVGTAALNYDMSAGGLDAGFSGIKNIDRGDGAQRRGGDLHRPRGRLGRDLRKRPVGHAHPGRLLRSRPCRGGGHLRAVRHRRRLRREEAVGARSPVLLVSGPGPAGMMPLAGTSMRGRHALQPARIGECRRRGTTAWGGVRCGSRSTARRMDLLRPCPDRLGRQVHRFRSLPLFA